MTKPLERRAEPDDSIEPAADRPFLTWDEERQLGDEWLADPDFKASVMAAVQKSLDDPRPAVSIDEIRRRMEAKFGEARRNWRL